ADSSQIPTYLVSKLARSKVTVSLSGDGGDELFGGYNRYIHAESIWRNMRRIPRPLRRSAGALVGAVPQGALTGAYSAVSRLLPRRYRMPFAGTKFHKLAIMSGARSGEEVYRSLVSMWTEPDALVIDAHEPTAMLEANESAELPDLMRRMMYADLLTYLVDDILVKVDRASMAVSLEARVPLLDHRVVEYAWRLPMRHKLANGRGKVLLRSLLATRVPPELFERPKMGFSVPVDEWLRGPLRDWAESTLCSDRLRRDGFLRPEPVAHEWQRFLRGLGSHARVWAVLMFQAWVDRYRPVG
ncbi:MAG: asparagine synthetase B, partial [Phycisphaerae bacterium]|nr:asparagine synthetase B [Phycisphaerae bacterium]